MLHSIQSLSYDILGIIQTESAFLDKMIEYINTYTEIKIKCIGEDFQDDWVITYTNGEQKRYCYDLKMVAIGIFHEVITGNKNIYTNDSFYSFKKDLMNIYEKALLKNKLEDRMTNKLFKEKTLKI